MSVEVTLAGSAIASLTASALKKLLKSEGISKVTVSKDNKFEEVAKWYRSEKMVIVLGAGASVAYGLPDWNTLLQKLLLISLQSDDNSDQGNTSILAKTFSNVFQPNSLVAARYLNNHFKKNHPTANLAFENAIRDSLYSEVKSKEDSALLKEIRQFCIAPGRSPNLDSIITYNYDDLLEKCLSNIAVEIPYCPIHASGMRHKDHELPIYHVHGYLPQGGQLTSKNKVVLSEDEYHQQYSDIYGWSNLTQINKFKENNCIFVGLSFSDPNLRRILDIAKKERGDNEIHHYCFKKRYSKSEVKNKLFRLIKDSSEIELDSEQSDLSMISNDLIELVEQFDENDAQSFGVGIIWVDNYNEIPESLRKIRLLI
ncbi:SIR2 family protein [Vibrio parahaemolyticus]|uniref:SIR2 family protein n=1 Tax=Vibrio parahaemolyticus TaxID=670 RepID=UPI0004254A8E|nr:SIR2 family protein [Vibrio parahaemolyticus]EIO4107013.1 SIR2 family protein [Vibrio vulnificus]EJL7824886.1 SIR2 family protein [Vibrio parahaemolyticus]HCH3755016.1 SIR2 family protein [Vibrio parahaemolyticus]HCH4151365.1 SIR2 family protein [Vibrio parahaemolyticus]